MQKIKTILSPVSWLPVPLPYDWMSSYDLLWANAKVGGGYSEKNTFIGVTIMDKYYPEGPIPQYYAVTGFFKLPLLIMILLVAAIVLGIDYIARKGKIPLLFWFTIFPSLFYLNRWSDM